MPEQEKCLKAAKANIVSGGIVQTVNGWKNEYLFFLEWKVLAPETFFLTPVLASVIYFFNNIAALKKVTLMPSFPHSDVTK